MNDMTGFAEHYGHWGLVAIMVLVASWILYRFAAPKGWRQWTGAGLVQAFIIALYAEMYGFPLTIYLLTGFLGIDIPRNAFTGHLWATLLGYGATGAMVEMTLGGLFVLFGIGLLVGGWRRLARGLRVLPRGAHRDRRTVQRGASSAVQRNHAGRLRPDRALADGRDARAVPDHRVCLRAACPKRRTRNAPPVRCRLRGLLRTGTDVLSASGSVGTIF